MGDEFEAVEESSAGLTRRSMIKRAAAAGAVAWTAPLIVESLASPAAAATIRECFQLQIDISSCRAVQATATPAGCTAPPTTGCTTVTSATATDTIWNCISVNHALSGGGSLCNGQFGDVTLTYVGNGNVGNEGSGSACAFSGCVFLGGEFNGQIGGSATCGNVSPNPGGQSITFPALTSPDHYDQLRFSISCA